MRRSSLIIRGLLIKRADKLIFYATSVNQLFTVQKQLLDILTDISDFFLL